MILEMDVPNKNNHVYPKYVIEQVVEMWKGKQMLGQIDMPTFADEKSHFLQLDRASHVVENLRIDDNNYLIGDITVLKTPAGKLLDDLMTVDGLCFRSCGVGNIAEDENGHMVITNYQMLSINAVFDGA